MNNCYYLGYTQQTSGSHEEDSIEYVIPKRPNTKGACVAYAIIDGGITMSYFFE